MMFSVQYVTTCMNSIDFSTSVQYIIEFLTFDIIGQTYVALSANIGVRNSVGFFTCDEFCRICYNCDE